MWGGSTSHLDFLRFADNNTLHRHDLHDLHGLLLAVGGGQALPDLQRVLRNYAIGAANCEAAVPQRAARDAVLASQPAAESARKIDGAGTAAPIGAKAGHAGAEVDRGVRVVGIHHSRILAVR